MSPSCRPAMDFSNAPSVYHVESPSISVNTSSSSSPMSVHARPQDDDPISALPYDAEASLGEGCSSSSSYPGLEMARRQVCSDHGIEEGSSSTCFQAGLKMARKHVCGISASGDAGLEEGSDSTSSNAVLGMVVCGIHANSDAGDVSLEEGCGSTSSCTVLDMAKQQVCSIHASSDVGFEEGLCSTSSRVGLEMANQQTCGIHSSNDTCLVHHKVIEGSLLHHYQGLNAAPCSLDDTNSVRPRDDKSGLGFDVEKGWGTDNCKVMDVDEEGSGEGCRVCQLTMDRSPSAGEIIKLGCACKDDLALAHQHCAETWFKIKGNRTCEICGMIAKNIGANRATNEANAVEARHLGLTRAERCWQNQPLCNTLVVCVLLVVIAAWLFRVTLF